MFVGESTQGVAVKGFLEAITHSSWFEVYFTISSRPARILKEKRLFLIKQFRWCNTITTFTEISFFFFLTSILLWPPDQFKHLFVRYPFYIVLDWCFRVSLDIVSDSQLKNKASPVSQFPCINTQVHTAAPKGRRSNHESNNGESAFGLY